MSGLATLALAGLQFLDPVPRVVEVGSPIDAVVSDAGGAPIAGVTVVLVDPAGHVQASGTTGSQPLALVPRTSGPHRLRAELAGVVLAAPVHVAAPAARGWLGALGAIAGGILLAVHLRRAR